MITDFLTLIAVILLAILVFFSFIKNLRSNDKRNKDLEFKLKSERDYLEKNISERTGSLVNLQSQRYEELQRYAEFGEMSQGLIHDLMNPLTAVSLFIEGANQGDYDIAKTKATLDKAVFASKRMKSYLNSVRSSLRTREIGELNVKANLQDEVEVVKDVLAYKARTKGVNMQIKLPTEKIILNIHPVRINQLLFNLLSNAIDSFPTNQTSKYVLLEIFKTNKDLGIIVQDDGAGMNDEQIQKAGKERFTSKEKGNGIGLMTIFSIAEKELGGKVAIRSGFEKGTTFEIMIPTSD